MFFFYYYFWNLFMQSVTLPVAFRTPVKALFPRGSFGHGVAQFWMFQMSNEILNMTQDC